MSGFPPFHQPGVLSPARSTSWDGWRDPLSTGTEFLPSAAELQRRMREIERGRREDAARRARLAAEWPVPVVP